MTTFAPVGVCPHGLPRDQYCFNCTYVEQPSTQELKPVRVRLVLELQAELHWTEEELNRAVAEYMAQYLEAPGYGPASDWYIRGCHVESDSDTNTGG